MRLRLAGARFDFNVESNVYFDSVDRGFRAHDTLALYKNKSVRAIGKVIARITAVETENEVKYNAEFGELTKVLGTEDIPYIEELAKRLRNEGWT